MISLRKADSFVFLGEATTDAKLGVREQFISKDMINEKI
jgi:hypothetical protein